MKLSNEGPNRKGKRKEERKRKKRREKKAKFATLHKQANETKNTVEWEGTGIGHKKLVQASFFPRNRKGDVGKGPNVGG